MSSYLPSFDFAIANTFPPEERVERSMNRISELLDRSDIRQYFSLPMIPPRGATESELHALENSLGIQLPSEYRAFLSRWRYLTIDDGYQIWGFDWEGVSYGTPWVSEEHFKDTRYLVIGNYWRFADGDDLLINLDDPDRPVVLYLHEGGPAFEPLAPSFSHLLWRVAHEVG